jgi:hypothetical protein
MNIRQRMIEAKLWDATDIRDPSEDIAAAWLVVEKIETHGWYVGVGWCNGKYGTEKRGWCYIGGHGADGAHVGGANTDTAPHAICLAALKAVGAIK